MTRRLALLLFWGWTAASAVQAQPPPPVVLTVYFSERPPFSVVEGQTGLLLDLTKVILAEAGLRARFIELPPVRILDLLRSGQRDALGVGLLRTADREAWGRFSQPLYQDKPIVAVVNTRASLALGNPVRLDELLASGLTLGLQGGSSLGAVLDRRIRAQGLVPLETAVETGLLLKMIQLGRMDYTLLCEDEAQYLLDHDATLTPGLAVVRLVEPPPGNQRHFLYASGFEPSLVVRIDDAIGRVRLSARYRELTLLRP